MRPFHWLSSSVVVGGLALAATAVAATTIPSRAADKTLEGKLEDGQVIDNVWASASNVACFPGTMDKYFSGKQVFLDLVQAPSKDLVIRVKPAAGVDVSVYALQLGPTQRGVHPPNVNSAWRCTPAYSKTAGGEESLRLTGNNGEFGVVLAVVGSEGASAGAFTVDVWEEAGRF